MNKYSPYEIDYEQGKIASKKSESISAATKLKNTSYF